MGALTGWNSSGKLGHTPGHAKKELAEVIVLTFMDYKFKENHKISNSIMNNCVFSFKHSSHVHQNPLQFFMKIKTV
jgi:hypothetical protein